MIRFLKIRDVASPEREAGNAGFDFFVPNFDEKFRADCEAEASKNPKAACIFIGKDAIVVKPHQRVSIPSGIKSRIELGLPINSYGLGIELKVENKSGVATKRGLDVGASIVDENYQGEIHLSVTNTTEEDVVIHSGDKIVQLIPYVYVTEEAKVFDIKDTTEEEFWKDFKWTNRGSGWAGSTSDKPNPELQNKYKN